MVLVRLSALWLLLGLVGCGLLDSQEYRCRHGEVGFEGVGREGGREDAFQNCLLVLLSREGWSDQGPNELAGHPVTAAVCARLYDRVLECDKKNPLPFSAHGL